MPSNQQFTYGRPTRNTYGEAFVYWNPTVTWHSSCKPVIIDKEPEESSELRQVAPRAPKESTLAFMWLSSESTEEGLPWRSLEPLPQQEFSSIYRSAWVRLGNEPLPDLPWALGLPDLPWPFCFPEATVEDEATAETGSGLRPYLNHLLQAPPLLGHMSVSSANVLPIQRAQGFQVKTTFPPSVHRSSTAKVVIKPDITLGFPSAPNFSRGLPCGVICGAELKSAKYLPDEALDDLDTFYAQGGHADVTSDNKLKFAYKAKFRRLPWLNVALAAVVEACANSAALPTDYYALGRGRRFLLTGYDYESDELPREPTSASMQFSSSSGHCVNGKQVGKDGAPNLLFTLAACSLHNVIAKQRAGEPIHAPTNEDEAAWSSTWRKRCAQLRSFEELSTHTSESEEENMWEGKNGRKKDQSYAGSSDEDDGTDFDNGTLGAFEGEGSIDDCMGSSGSEYVP